MIVACLTEQSLPDSLHWTRLGRYYTLLEFAFKSHMGVTSVSIMASAAIFHQVSLLFRTSCLSKGLLCAWFCILVYCILFFFFFTVYLIYSPRLVIMNGKHILCWIHIMDWFIHKGKMAKVYFAQIYNGLTQYWQVVVQLCTNKWQSGSSSQPVFDFSSMEAYFEDIDRLIGSKYSISCATVMLIIATLLAVPNVPPLRFICMTCWSLKMLQERS